MSYTYKDMEMTGTKIKVKRLIAVLLFCAIALFVFTRYCNVMRVRNSESANITGLSTPNNVDVVFIGSSVTHTSWLPYRAWDEYGITSYDFATDGPMIGSEAGTIRYIKHHQPDAKLFVIDVRSYLKAGATNERVPFVKINNMDYSLDRFRTIAESWSLCEDKTLVDSPLNYNFDILMYQSEREALGSPENWEYINNDVESNYLGCTINGSHMFVDAPEKWTENKEPLAPFADKSIKYLLKYAKENDIDILFTLLPYTATVPQMERANAIADIITENGGTFLNICGEFSPFEVDYEKDFYNPRHFNIFGAEKYTHFLGQYIQDNYDIEDHRGDPKYEEWNGCTERAYKKEASAKARIEKSIEKKNSDSEYMAQLNSIDNFYDWYNKAEIADGLSVFMVSRGEIPEVTGDYNRIWQKIGFAGEKNTRLNWVSTGDEALNYENETFEGMISAQNTMWTITQVNDAGSIMIDGDERSLQKEGVNVVAWDDNRSKVVDRFVLVSDGAGGLVIKR